MSYIDVTSEFNNKFLSMYLSDTSAMSPNESIAHQIQGIEPTEPHFFKEEPAPFRPIEKAKETQTKIIVQGVQKKEEDAKKAEVVTRLAQAVAEAMKPAPVVGQVKADGAVVGEPIAPQTVPEGRATILAGIKAVGKGGRKGVFSELPMEAEDIPEGWDVAKGRTGWWTAPSDDMEDVLYNDSIDESHVNLGYVAPKTPEDSLVVRAKDKEGTTIQDVTTSDDNLDASIEQAKEVGESVDIVTPEKAIEERLAKPIRSPHESSYAIDVANPLKSMVTITGEEEHPEGYVSAMTQLADGSIGKAKANREGRAYPYMFEVAGKGWEVDSGYGHLIASGLSKKNAETLVRKTKPVTLEVARGRMEKHLTKDLQKIKTQYPKLEATKQSALAMMLYQGGEGLNVARWNNTNKALRKAIASNDAKDWYEVQRNMLDSKWAKIQTPERALKVISLMLPTTSKKQLEDDLLAVRMKSKSTKSGTKRKA